MPTPPPMPTPWAVAEPTPIPPPPPLAPPAPPVSVPEPAPMLEPTPWPQPTPWPKPTPPPEPQGSGFAWDKHDFRVGNNKGGDVEVQINMAPSHRGGGGKNGTGHATTADLYREYYATHHQNKTKKHQSTFKALAELFKSRSAQNRNRHRMNYTDMLSEFNAGLINMKP